MVLLFETKIAMTNKNNARANKKVDYQITAIQYVHILGIVGLQKPFTSI